MNSEQDLFDIFNTKHGKRIIENLKNITINQIFGPDISNDKLRHIEGQRFIVNYIINKAKKTAILKNYNNK